jgi:hypothetical protein
VGSRHGKVWETRGAYPSRVSFVTARNLGLDFVILSQTRFLVQCRFRVAFGVRPSDASSIYWLTNVGVDVIYVEVVDYDQDV